MSETRQHLAALLAATTADQVTVPRGWLSELLEAPAAHADLTVDQVAKELIRGDSTVRGWCKAGLFPNAYRLRDREWRIPEADLLAFLAREREVRTRAPAGAVARRASGKAGGLEAWRGVRPRETEKA